jgi:hypothetical protein
MMCPRVRYIHCLSSLRVKRLYSSNCTWTKLGQGVGIYIKTIEKTNALFYAFCSDIIYRPHPTSYQNLFCTAEVSG